MNMKKSVKKDQKFANIIGIKVNSTPVEKLLVNLEYRVSHNTPKGRNSRFYIVTPNPELVLLAQRDPVLKNALNSTEFSLPDGIGLVMASRFLNLEAPNNKIIRFVVALVQGLAVGVSVVLNRRWLTAHMKPIRGRTFFIDLMRLANKHSWKVYFLGGYDNEAEAAAERMLDKYKKIKVRAEAGPIFDNDGEPASKRDRKAYLEVVKRINSFAPQILIVCLQDPKEEKFVYKNYKKLNIVGVGAFGGTFRYIAGLSPLPPKWMEKAGLEWVYRLITEPYRIRRILNAFPIFPLKIFWFKLNH